MSHSNLFDDWSDDELAQELALIADRLAASAAEVPGRESSDLLRDKAIQLMHEASRRLSDD